MTDKTSHKPRDMYYGRGGGGGGGGTSPPTEEHS